MPEEFESATMTGHFFVCLKKTQAGKSRLSWGQRFQKIIFSKNVFRAHENAKPAFSNSSGLKGVFEKLRFRDGLVWTEGLTVQIKLRFRIPPAYCGRDLSWIDYGESWERKSDVLIWHGLFWNPTLNWLLSQHEIPFRNFFVLRYISSSSSF